MANYTTADIKALRERTGAGMMDVKRALDESGGDAEKALEIIRIKGLKGIAKREGRATSDGLVAIEVADGPDGQVGTLVEVNSETDFVAKSPVFVALADKVLAQAVAQGTQDVAALLESEVEPGLTLQNAVDQVQAALGEKLQVRRVAVVRGDHVTSYLHKTNKDLPPQVGVLVATDAPGLKAAKDIAMHIAAYSPTFLSEADVPAETVDNERRVAEEIARNEGKPEGAIPKIVEGRLGGFFKENVLLNQAYAKDGKLTVAQVLKEVDGQVTGFARFRVGA
ncbi:MAG: translation elongation factor Ts [Bifidobacteriaceae bacterium]|jgi:elongation factor Ts|nr:translation elongation factor Ts [Bifidobacteriaceae bacterium]